MRLDYLPDIKAFAWNGRFDERHFPERHGFEWNSEVGRWITTNPVVAARTGLKGEQVAEAKRKLNLSTAVSCRVMDVLTSFPMESSDATANLFPYQEVPYEYAKDDRFLLLTDDTGLGKTIEALDFTFRENHRNLLIICPANKREDWLKELKKWTNLHGYVHYDGLPKIALESYPTFITSWALLQSYVNLDLLKFYTFDHLILDEVHHMKNADSLRTQLALELSSRCGRVTALSATFPPNYPTELWPLLNHFSPHTIDHLPYQRFMYKYCTTREYQGKVTPTGFRNTLDLSQRLRSTCMVRRRYHWVHKQTPKPILKLIKVKPDAIWEQIVFQEKRFEREYLKDGIPRKIPTGEYATFRQKTAVHRIDLVVNYLLKAFEKEDKICVFGWHVALIEGLARHNRLREFNPVCITGKVTAKKKYLLKEAFQDRPHIRLFCGNIKAAGQGIDLFAARHIVFAEASWVPGENHQAIGRVHRYGQARQVYADFVVVDGTLDCRVLETALKKQEGLDELLDTREEEDEWEN